MAGRRQLEKVDGERGAGRGAVKVQEEVEGRGWGAVLSGKWGQGAAHCGGGPACRSA